MFYMSQTFTCMVCYDVCMNMHIIVYVLPCNTCTFAVSCENYCACKHTCTRAFCISSHQTGAVYILSLESFVSLWRNTAPHVTYLHMCLVAT